MPGAVPRTSTFALTNSTLPFALKLANRGLIEAIERDPHLKKGVNTYKGRVTFQAVADDQGLPYTPIDELV
jgi:alanine dehydrogenase